jgi:hypothetical protein
MSVFEKLLSLNKDIELLEAFGDIKSANILHKKFIREAQSLDPKRDSGPYKQVFDRYFNTAKINPSQKLISSIRSDRFLLKEDQDQLVDYITEMIQTKPPVQQAQPQVPVSTTAPTTTPGLNLSVTPQPKNVNDARFLNTPKLNLNQTPAVQQPTSPVNSDTSNINAAMESMYSAVNQASEQQNVTQTPKVNEQQLYMNSLNEIIELYKTKRPEAIDAAEQIYVDTYTQLTNQASKNLFLQQIQRLRTKYNTARIKGQR